MARGINKVILIGNLGGDPEVRYTPNGSAVANLNVATSDSWTDKNTGQRQDRTEWHRVALFGKLAEIAQQYLRKGSKVYIEGSLRTNKWQDQQGQDRYSTEIVVSGYSGQMQMLDGRQEGAPMGGGYQQQAPAQAPQQQAPTQAQQQPSYGAPQQQPPRQQAPVQQQSAQQPQATPAGGFDDFDDDIPF